MASSETSGHLQLRQGPVEFLHLRADDARTFVLLHEGLGSVSMWRDFPSKLMQATGCSVFAYSRYGYGDSAACPLPRPVTYMHEEAIGVLPELLVEARIGNHVLVGHSDGGSIALIHAGAASRPGLKGLVVLAPHVFVEDISVKAIERARLAWKETDLRAKLGRFHGGNTDCAFLGWNGAWLDPKFRDWNIEPYLPAIEVPITAIQGHQDEYGTMAQVDAISAVAKSCRLIKLDACGHSPHKDQLEKVVSEIGRIDF